MVISEPTLEDFEKLTGEAEKFVEESRKRRSSGFNYLPKGRMETFWIPVQLKSGKWIFIRRFWVHFWKEIGRFACTKMWLDSCEQCDQVERLKSNGFTKVFKLGQASEVGIVKLYPFNVEDDQYLKPNKLSYVVMYSNAFGPLYTWLNGMEAKDVQRNFLPLTKPHQTIILNFDPENTKTKMSVSFSGKERKIPASILEEDTLPSITKTFISRKDVPNDENMQAIRKFVSQQINQKVNLADDNSGDRENNHNRTGRSRLEFDSDDADVNEEAETDKKIKPVCPSDDAKLKFGRHPLKQHEDCMLCPYEPACKKLTKKRLED